MPQHQLQGEETLFDLVYEGATDDSTRTLQKIKGVFVADLNLSVPDVQRILDHAPSTISSAESKEQLEEARKKLIAAGARVLIIQRNSVEDAPHGDRILEQLLKEVAEEEEQREEEALHETTTPTEPSSHEDEFSFELNLDQDSVHVRSEPRAQKVYNIDLNEVENVEEIVKSLETPVSPPVHNTPRPVESATDVPAVSGAHLINLLSEEELKEFHLSRGGSLEEPVSAVPVIEEEDDGPLIPAEVPLHVQPEHISPALTPHVAVEDVALVLEDVSAQIDEAQIETVPSTPPPVPKSENKAAAVKSHASTTPLKPPPASIGLELTFEEPVSAPDSGTEQKKTSGVDLTLQPLATEVRAPPPPPPPPITTRQQQAPEVEVIPEHGSAHTETPSPPPAPVALPAPTPTKRAPRKKSARNWLELGIPIVAGTAVIAVANWLYFAPGTPPPAALSKTQTELLLSSIQAEEKKSLPTPTSLKIWEPSRKDAGRQVRARVVEGERGTILKSFTIETDAPRERTNEEVARGILLPPWLKKIECGPFQFIPVPDSTTGDLMTNGAALIYVVYGGAAVRLVGKFEATLMRSTLTEPNRITYSISLGSVPEGIDKSAYINRDASGNYTVAANGSIEFGAPLEGGA